MKKRSLLTSVVTSTVLAGVLMMSGCGGSNSVQVETLPNLGKDDSVAVGTSKILADSDGNLNIKIPLVSENNKVQVAEVIFSQVLKNGVAACTQLVDNCEVKAKQVSACGIDASSDAFIAAISHLEELKAGAGDRYDDAKDMVVFGGTLLIDAEGFDECNMALSINMIDCGSAFKTDGGAVEAGFSNENHIVDVYVSAGTIAPYASTDSGKWMRNIRIKDGKILMTAEQLDSLKLPATFTFYSIKDSDKDGTTKDDTTKDDTTKDDTTKDSTTGVTGATGGEGY